MDRVPDRRRRRRRGALLACAVVLLVAASSVPAVASRDDASPTAPAAFGRETSFEGRLEAAFADLERSGVSAIVAASHGGGPIVVREFGALKDDGIPADATQVDLNSITKTVTAVAVLKLVEQGKLRLDETLVEIFADAPADKAAITVHQLLTHSAGVVDSVGSDEERLGKADFLARAFGSALVAPPGERYHYSNVGYSILAAIVETRSGMSYETYLRDEVLAGSGLDDTGYAAAYDERRSLRTADGQTIREASWGGHDPFWNLVGNGGLVSTADDFVRFRRAVAAGRVVSPALVAQSQTPHVPEDEARTSFYGYGLVVQERPDVGRFYWHDGGNDVFSAMWVDLAERGDLLFTAAVDSAAGDAFSAMEVLEAHLAGGADE